MSNYKPQNYISVSAKEKKWEDAKTTFYRVFNKLLKDNILYVTDKQNGRTAWFVFLPDWDKTETYWEFRKNPRGIDLKDYGKILDSDWGEEVPQDIKEKRRIFVYFIKFDDCLKTYYVASNVDKDHEMKTAASIEDVRRCGKILYSSSDDDPAEAIVYFLKQEYYGLGSQIKSEIESHFDDIAEGGIEKVKKYLDAKHDVNSVDQRGWTLLHHFAKCNNKDVLSLLTNNKADIHMQDKICGRKPVLIAAREGHIEAIKFFLRNGANVKEADKNNWSLLHYAAWNGNKDTVSFLIQEGADIKAKESTLGKMPIHIAAEYGHTEVVKFLLGNGSDIEDGDNSGRTPLYYAAWAARLETAKALIDMGAEFNKPNKIGTKPLHIAADTQCTETIDLFLVSEESVNEPDIDGNTPLLRAVIAGNLEVVKFLVIKGANVNVVNNKGCTPFRSCTLDKLPDLARYIADKMGTSLQDEEKYSEALSMYSQLFDIQKEKLGLDHTETLQTRNTIADLYYKQGLYDEAASAFKDVLKDRERCLGPNHIETLCTRHGLGLVYCEQIKYDEALKIFKEVFEVRKIRLGTDHHDTLNVARDMASVHLGKGQYDCAYDILKDVYETRRASFGADHAVTLKVGQDMAMALVNLGEYKKAVNILKDVFEKRKYTLGDDHPETLFTRQQISIISEKFEAELKEQEGCMIQ